MQKQFAKHYTIKTRLLLTNGLSPLLNEKLSMSISPLVLLSSSALPTRSPVISTVSQSAYRLLSMLLNVGFPLVRDKLTQSFVQIPYSGPD
jgi:hypothetical protein